LGQKEKLIEKLKSKPKTFTFEDAESLLGYFNYHRSNKGKTSGSREMFSSHDHKLTPGKNCWNIRSNNSLSN